MEQLIPIVNKLQDVFGAIGESPIDLPQIIVIGSQSSGKSSVLENVVGKGFLPRGTGIVTRRPLILQLYNTSNYGSGGGGGGGREGGGESPDKRNNSSGSGGGLSPMQEALSPVRSNSPSLDEENVTPNSTSASNATPKQSKNSSKSSTSTTTNNTSSSSSSSSSNIAASNNNNTTPLSPSQTILPGDEWGEFLHLPNKKFYEFDEIRDEITRETDRSTGRNKGISNKALNLKIYSPLVLNLTLVDLPGITKVSIGDQPADIEEQIREMCLSYITNPHAIILAVTAGNTDLANSDALKMARSVDPEGLRTIGVVTKLDLMDPGTDASDLLNNRVIPLRRGYVGVINRGQKDILSKKTIRDGLKKEIEFFKSHPSYRGLMHRCGTSTLSKMLNSILMHHIRDCLPDIKNRITSMMADIQLELDALGTPSLDISRATLGGSLLSLLSKFASSFNNAVEGRGSSADGIEMNELYGGARISYIFTEIFGRSLMSIDTFDGLTDDDIRTAICNANGPRPSLFVPEISFDLLVRRQIGRLEQPGLQCIDLVFDELHRMSSQCEPPELSRFPELRDRLLDVVSGLLRRCVGPTQMMISNLVKIELAYINTSHPDFIGGSRAVAQLMERMGNEGSSNNQNNQSGSNGQGNGNNPLKPPNGDGSGSAKGGSEKDKNKEGIKTPNSKRDDQDHPHTPRYQDDDYDGNNSSQSRNNARNGTLREEETKGGLLGFIFGGKSDKTNQSAPHNSSNNSSSSSNNRRTSMGTTTASSPNMVKLPQVPDTMRQTSLPSDRERIETEIIKSLIHSYFAIVRKNFLDMVPKTIMYFLVNHSRDSLQNELVSELYKDECIQELMRETDDIAQRRRTCRDMRALLKRALEIVNEVRDFNTFK